MVDLEEIDGVGPSYAEELESNGYESAQDVAAADPDELDDLIETLNGDELIASAQDVVGDNSGDTVVADGEPVETDDGSERYALGLELNENQRNHLVKAFVNEEIRARRTNKQANVEIVQDAINETMGSGSYEYTKEQLDTGYRALNQLEAEYRSQRGVGSFVTEIRNVKNAFQDARQDAHPSTTN